jgi:hypothetical protein
MRPPCGRSLPLRTVRKNALLGAVTAQGISIDAELQRALIRWGSETRPPYIMMRERIAEAAPVENSQVVLARPTGVQDPTLWLLESIDFSRPSCYHNSLIEHMNLSVRSITKGVLGIDIICFFAFEADSQPILKPALRSRRGLLASSLATKSSADMVQHDRGVRSGHQQRRFRAASTASSSLACCRQEFRLENFQKSLRCRHQRSLGKPKDADTTHHCWPQRLHCDRGPIRRGNSRSRNNGDAQPA